MHGGGVPVGVAEDEVDVVLSDVLEAEEEVVVLSVVLKDEVGDVELSVVLECVASDVVGVEVVLSDVEDLVVDVGKALVLWDVLWVIWLLELELVCAEVVVNCVLEEEVVRVEEELGLDEEDVLDVVEEGF